MRPTFVALVCTLLVAVSAHAQNRGDLPDDGARIRTVSLVGGASQFDLGTTGTAAFGGVRGDIELNRWFLAEAAVSATRMAASALQATYVFPEVQLQLQLPYRIVRPYLGVGTGVSSVFDSERSDRYKQTFSAAAGMRALLPGTSTTVRAELRLRKIGPQTSASMADWSFGLGRRF